MSLDNNIMEWAGAPSYQTVTSDMFTISICSNDHNLNAFVARNNAWPDSNPSKIPADRTAAYLEYTDGYCL